MHALVAVVQEVELVGDGSWLHENLGSVVVAVAAIVAAALAATVANRNHKRQLANDRELQAQDHVREVIDAADVAATDADSAVADYLLSSGGTNEWRADLCNGATDKLNAVKDLTHRLKIRLGEDAPIATRHAAIGDELEALLLGEIERRGGDHASEPGPPQSKEAQKARWAPTRAAFREFRRECHEWFVGRPAESAIGRLKKQPHALATRIRAVR